MLFVLSLIRTDSGVEPSFDIGHIASTLKNLRYIVEPFSLYDDGFPTISTLPRISSSSCISSGSYLGREGFSIKNCSSSISLEVV
jgi:hypothetical protein